MKVYLVLGVLRNIVGIAILTYLVKIGIPVTAALLVVVFVGFFLYQWQVRYSIGAINLSRIGTAFVFIYFSNRLLLWMFHEQFQLEIYYAQLISVALLSLASYRFLNEKTPWRKAIPREESE